MTSLDLTRIPGVFNTAVLDHCFREFLDKFLGVPDEILVTAHQKASIRSPHFQPYNEWRGVPIRVKGKGDDDLRIVSEIDD